MCAWFFLLAPKKVYCAKALVQLLLLIGHCHLIYRIYALFKIALEKGSARVQNRQAIALFKLSTFSEWNVCNPVSRYHHLVGARNTFLGSNNNASTTPVAPVHYAQLPATHSSPHNREITAMPSPLLKVRVKLLLSLTFLETIAEAYLCGSLYFTF